MKLAYVVPYAVYSSKVGIYSAIETKIQNQISGLKKNGVDVDLINLPLKVTDPINFFKSSLQGWRYLNKIIHTEKYSIIYCRHFYPYIVNAQLVSIMLSTKIVFEAQDIQTKSANISKNLTPIKNIENVYLKCFDLLFGKYISSHADGIVSVTPEISAYHQARTKGSSKYLSLGNGINTTSLKIRHCPQLQNKLHILCVANLHYWHGVDRMIHGMKLYEGTSELYLHIVGNGHELPNLKSLTKELHLEDHVIFHGFKSGTELDAMFDECHIALDALAGFRKNLNELSTLKAREYCARGIPFLMASKDADFPESWDYIQMVPATEDPIDMELVIAFADRVLADYDHPQKMHEYAKDHLDWLAKMKVLKEFLEKL